MATKHFSGANREIEGSLRNALVRKLQQLSIMFYKEIQSGRLQSKVMRDVIGRNMVAGINVGIEDETPGLEKVSRQSASRAVEAMQDGAYRKAEATGAEATEKYNPGAPDDNGGQPVDPQRRWRVEVPVYLDGREMARGMAEFTNEQLAWEGL